MASFLRGKQSGMQNDLSAAILPGLFAPDDRARYGINSQISCMAYDPVQSLLAIGTNESKFGSGKIYVFGQTRVDKFLWPPRKTSFKSLHFWADKLVSLDTKNEISIWDLNSGKRVNGTLAPGHVASLVVDPMLDWAFIGTQNGEVYAYDLDRERMSAFRLPNFWKDRVPNARLVTLVSMQLHPRDIGKLLIAYSHGAVIYSFKQNQPIKYFEYQLQPGAPGGNGHNIETPRRPQLLHAMWHPTGTFIATAHDDGSLVFWDAKDGRVVMARSISDAKVDQPTPTAAKPSLKDPFVRISWCCKENPEDTGLIIAGGQPADGEKGLTFLELGATPNYATSSWQILETYLQGKRLANLPTPPGAEVVDYCLIPRLSPHFGGSQDPIAVLVLLSSGELITMSFPSGFPISPTNQLHPSLSFIHPFATRLNVTNLDRERWLGMVETRSQGEPLLKGGAEDANKPRRRHEARNIIQVAHADSTVRIWDLGHADQMENPTQLQLDIARALNRYENIDITVLNMAPGTGEFAAGTSKGEVVIYRWGGNRSFGRDDLPQLQSNPGGLVDISSRAESTLKSGLQPLVLYEMMQGPITALSVADVGFVAVGSENGGFGLIDLRGPSIIFQASMAEFSKQERRTSFLKGLSSSNTGKEWPVVIEFGVMTLDDDKYSSICCFVGTSHGKVLTFKLLPSGGGYTTQFVASAQLGDRIISVSPIIADTGKPAAATGQHVAGLREGKQINGTLVVVTQTEIRIFRPASSKGATKSFDDILCDAASVTEFDLHGMALVAVFGDQTTRAFSLPGLKEIGASPLSMMDSSRSTATVVTPNGDVIGWTGPSEIAVLQVWGTAQPLLNSLDTLINPELLIPPRPTISTTQWISGTQYVSPTDLDLLVGGPDRPPSKRMLAATANEERLSRAGPASPRGTPGGANEGWGDYLTRQLNERTEKLNIMNDSMESAAEQSQKWAEDVGKFVNKQKRNMLLGGITSKFS